MASASLSRSGVSLIRNDSDKSIATSAIRSPGRSSGGGRDGCAGVVGTSGSNTTASPSSSQDGATSSAVSLTTAGTSCGSKAAQATTAYRSGADASRRSVTAPFEHTANPPARPSAAVTGSVDAGDRPVDSTTWWPAECTARTAAHTRGEIVTPSCRMVVPSTSSAISSRLTCSPPPPGIRTPTRVGRRRRRTQRADRGPRQSPPLPALNDRRISWRPPSSGRSGTSGPQHPVLARRTLHQRVVHGQRNDQTHEEPARRELRDQPRPELVPVDRDLLAVRRRNARARDGRRAAPRRACG